MTVTGARVGRRGSPRTAVTARRAASSGRIRRRAARARRGSREPRAQRAARARALSSRASGSVPSRTAAAMASAAARASSRWWLISSRSAPAASASTAPRTVPPPLAIASISRQSVIDDAGEAELVAQQTRSGPRATASPDARASNASTTTCAAEHDRGRRARRSRARTARGRATRSVGKRSRSRAAARVRVAAVAPWPGKCLSAAATPPRSSPRANAPRMRGDALADRRRTRASRSRVPARLEREVRDGREIELITPSRARSRPSSVPRRSVSATSLASRRPPSPPAAARRRRGCARRGRLPDRSSISGGASRPRAARRPSSRSSSAVPALRANRMTAPGANARSASSGASPRVRALEPDADDAARERRRDRRPSCARQCLIRRMICATNLPAVFEMKIWTFEPFETSVSV